jgi:hypothetical protein
MSQSIKNIFDSDIYSRPKFNQDYLFNPSSVKDLSECENLEDCFRKSGSYYKVKSDCAVRVVVPVKSGSSDKTHQMELIIPPDTKVDFASGGRDNFRSGGRAEKAVCSRISYDSDYYGSNVASRAFMAMADKSGSTCATSLIDGNSYCTGNFYQALYPINKMNKSGIYFPPKVNYN